MDSPPIKQILFTHSPLWMRAPSRDENGHNYSDFMMLIPGLGKRTIADLEAKIQLIQNTINQFTSVVVYADINTKINVLWVSHKSIPGVSRPIIAALLKNIPEAKIVGTGYEPEPESKGSKISLLTKLNPLKFLSHH